MNRTIAITGANRGIGHAVARALAAHPDAASLRVVMACRDPVAGARARDELARSSRAELVLVTGSLGNIRAIHETADQLDRTCSSIDVLIHNAGIWPATLERNTDGLEQAFVVNHLAPFVLNRRLEPKLAAGKARVVQVSAGLYVKGKVDLTRTPTGEDFSALTTYANTKLCNLLLLGRFAERFGPLGVTINAVHPGVIRTGLGDRSGLVGLLLKQAKRFWKAPEQAARPILRLALDPALANTTGRYYHEETEQALLPVARNPEQAEALWRQAEALTGLAEREQEPAVSAHGTSTAR